jgi:hypothetical protein
MKTLPTYDEFKELCSSFPVRLGKLLPEDGGFFCHPVSMNLLITACTIAEKNTHAPEICRMADVMLMSEDNEHWQPFNLREARFTATQNGGVYITDILGEGSFYAEDWMINGQNDRIIVSIEHMERQGKRYAPVTPLTTAFIDFKKIESSSFWHESEIGSPFICNIDTLKTMLSDYRKQKMDASPKLKYAERVTMPLFELSVIVDIASVRRRMVSRFIAQIEEIWKDLEDSAALLRLIDVVPGVFIAGSVKDVLSADGIAAVNISGESLEQLTASYLNAVNASREYELGVTVNPKYNEGFAELEGTPEEDEKFLICSLLSLPPANNGIYEYVWKKYPLQHGNIDNISDFWGTPAVDEIVEPINEIVKLPETDVSQIETAEISPETESEPQITDFIKNLRSEADVKTAEAKRLRKQADDLLFEARLLYVKADEAEAEAQKDASIKAAEVVKPVKPVETVKPEPPKPAPEPVKPAPEPPKPAPEPVKPVVSMFAELEALAKEVEEIVPVVESVSTQAQAFEQAQAIALPYVNETDSADDIDVPEISDIADIAAVEVPQLKPVTDTFEGRIKNIYSMDADALNAFRNELEGQRSKLDNRAAADIEQRITARENALEIETLDAMTADTDGMTLETAQKLLDELSDGTYNMKNTAPYIKRINEKIDALFVDEIERFTSGAENMSPDELTALRAKVPELPLPDYIKQRTETKIDRIRDTNAERDINEMIGDINKLNEKDATDIIRKINMIKLDAHTRVRYVDKLDAHISKIREEEAQAFIEIMQRSMRDTGLSNAQICIHGSALFHGKIEKATGEYASVGRFEQPLIVGDNAKTEEAFLLTTDFLYIRNKAGGVNRIKLDDIEDIRTDRPLIGVPKIICKTATDSIDIPHTFDKKSVDSAAKVIYDVVNTIKDKRSADRLKAIEEANAKRSKNDDPPAPISGITSETIAEKNTAETVNTQKAAVRNIRNPADTDKRGVEIDLTDVGADLEALAANLDSIATFNAASNDSESLYEMSEISAPKMDALDE